MADKEFIKIEALDITTYNRPYTCEKCGGIMVFKGVGEYKCEDCGSLEYDDYGIVRNYIEQHAKATMAYISEQTGVSQKSIRQMLKREDWKLHLIRGCFFSVKSAVQIFVRVLFVSLVKMHTTEAGKRKNVPAVRCQDMAQSEKMDRRVRNVLLVNKGTRRKETRMKREVMKSVNYDIRNRPVDDFVCGNADRKYGIYPDNGLVSATAAKVRKEPTTDSDVVAGC